MNPFILPRATTLLYHSKCLIHQLHTPRERELPALSLSETVSLNFLRLLCLLMRPAPPSSKLKNNVSEVQSPHPSQARDESISLRANSECNGHLGQAADNDDRMVILTGVLWPILPMYGQDLRRPITRLSPSAACLKEYVALSLTCTLRSKRD